jgi:transposase-like protein
VCEELRERYEAFKRRDLYDLRLVALFLDATYLAVRPDGPKEGVLVAWGFTEAGERVLLSVMLGMRESYEDWLELGRDLIARGLGAPLLVVADGARGVSVATESRSVAGGVYASFASPGRFVSGRGSGWRRAAARIAR